MGWERERAVDRAVEREAETSQERGRVRESGWERERVRVRGVRYGPSSAAKLFVAVAAAEGIVIYYL